MQHNIKKIKEVLVPYTAEENAELSGGEDTVPPPLPPRRPPPRAASADAPDAPPLPQRTPQTEAEGRAAMKAYKGGLGEGERRGREPADHPGQPGRRPGVPRAPHAGVGLVVRPRSWGFAGSAPLSTGVATDQWR